MRLYNIVILLFSFHSVSYAQSLNGFDLSDASIPIEEIFKGGPQKDGIPAIDNPTFIPMSRYDEYDLNVRILGVTHNGVSKAYPINILNYHEIVNDLFKGKPVVVTYCPLCGSGLSFNSVFEGERLQFGVSGLLYNSDVLLYDRNTGSLWSQILQQSVSGELKGTKLEIITTENTTLSEWIKRFPKTEILSRNTGFERNYDVTPYTGYSQSSTIYFPISQSSDLFHPKEMVLGVIINERSKAYTFTELEKNGNQIRDAFEGIDLIIEFDPDSYSARLINPPDNVSSFTTFWFAWYTFHPDTYVYKVSN